MQRIHCQGAPRDLGFDQGRACREAIRREVERLGLPRPGPLAVLVSAWRSGRGRPGTPHAAQWRQVLCHFPHLAERTLAMAAAAGVSSDALGSAFVAETDRAVREERRFEVGFATDEGPNDGALLGGAWPAKLAPDGGILRESVPDAAFRSLEWTRPWLVGALAGVNERGLAGAWQPAPERSPGLLPPFAALLLQQCLERFDSVEKCLDWCERRPSGGAAVLLFADAGGDARRIALGGARPKPLAATPAEPARGGEHPSEPAPVALRLLPSERRIEWHRPGGAEWESLALP